MSERMICQNIRVSGVVQGVGFRATTRGLAGGLPVTGWVKNEPDGSVQVEVQGSAKNIAALRERIRETLGLFIDDENAIDIPEIAGETAFVIRR